MTWQREGDGEEWSQRSRRAPYCLGPAVMPVSRRNCLSCYSSDWSSRGVNPHATMLLCSGRPSVGPCSSSRPRRHDLPNKMYRDKESRRGGPDGTALLRSRGAGRFHPARRGRALGIADEPGFVSSDSCSPRASSSTSLGMETLAWGRLTPRCLAWVQLVPVWMDRRVPISQLAGAEGSGPSPMQRTNRFLGLQRRSRRRSASFASTRAFRAARHSQPS